MIDWQPSPLAAYVSVQVWECAYVVTISLKNKHMRWGSVDDCTAAKACSQWVGVQKLFARLSDQRLLRYVIFLRREYKSNLPRLILPSRQIEVGSPQNALETTSLFIIQQPAVVCRSCCEEFQPELHALGWRYRFLPPDFKKNTQNNNSPSTERNGDRQINK